MTVFDFSSILNSDESISEIYGSDQESFRVNNEEFPNVKCNEIAFRYLLDGHKTVKSSICTRSLVIFPQS